MRDSIMRQLLAVTEEEQYYLSGHSAIQSDLYIKNYREIDARKFLKEGRLITVRHHSRFVEFPEHTHNYAEFMYVCSGEITQIIDGTEITLRPGDFIMMNQSVTHAVKRAGKEDIGINFIVLPEFFDVPIRMLHESKRENVIADFLVRLFREKDAPAQYLWFRLGEFWEIDNLMENLVGALLRDESESAAIGNPETQERENFDQTVYQYTMGLIFLLLTHHVTSLQKRSSQDYKELLVQSALHYIDTSYSSATLSKVAEDFHVSISFASRLIREKTGFTFQQHLMKKRFQKAVILLLETDLSIEEIIPRVGYENVSYFFREFKKRYGTTPRKYRRQHKNDGKIRL